MPLQGFAVRMLTLSAATLCLIAIPSALGQGSRGDAAPANAAPLLSGPGFMPDGSFRGSTLAGWHTLGQADWRADQDEITGKGTGAGGSGWLVLDRPFQDTGLYAAFQCVGPCDGTAKRLWSHLDDYFDADPYGPAVLYWYKTVRNPKAPGGAELVPQLVHNRSVLDRTYSPST